MKENKLTYEEAVKLGKDFLEYTLSSISNTILAKSLNKDGGSVLDNVLQNFILQNFIVRATVALPTTISPSLPRMTSSQ